MQSKASTTAGSVKVVCRFRPLNEKQTALGINYIQQLEDDRTVQIKDKDSKDKEGQRFTFDRVFGLQSNQQQIYNYAAYSIIDSVIQGFNGTIFAYGQTASGKTHTMQGDIDSEINPLSGIIPRMVQQVFDTISKSSQNIQFRIKVSLVELYTEKLQDLLNPLKCDLKIRSDKKRGIFIENLTQQYVSCCEQVYQLIKTARDSRVIASTNMNEKSSRSHMIFVLTISQNNINDLSAKTGKLYLVDLAGSQKVGKTGVEGKLLDEAKKINASLTALGKVINALTDGKSTHVPYRDSKLTRVLQQSLGGNSKTTLIVTCSPHPNNLMQTISTLRFGISAKKIKNKPKINKEVTVAELQSLLEKADKSIQCRENYINQLKNYIMIDLKQKKVPQFQADKNLGSIQNEENDLIGELQRQLEMENNLRIAQNDEIIFMKTRIDQLTSAKDELQKKVKNTKNENEELKIELHPSVISTITNESSNLKDQSITLQELLKGLTQITQDETVLQYVEDKSKNEFRATDHNYRQLLELYELEKEKRKQSEEQLVTNEKNLKKKLMQLENNICQLTHSYYDYVVGQHRYKVDSIFLKKELDEKKIYIGSLQSKIKDLEDQNRQLEEQKWNDDDEKPKVTHKSKLMNQLEDSKKHFLEALEHKNQQLHQHPIVVKVVKGKAK